MKILKKIKLNAISENNLENREMNGLRGGRDWECGCGCHYERIEYGGSSTADNANANYIHGYGSSGGNRFIFYGGRWWSCGGNNC